MHAEAMLHVHGKAHLLERQQRLHAAMLVSHYAGNGLLCLLQTAALPCGCSCAASPDIGAQVWQTNGSFTRS